jgi:hypothetical protein
MEALRQSRNARMKSAEAKQTSPDTLGKALRQRIRDDYWHARGSNAYGGCMAEQTRWHPDAYIPTTTVQFNKEWRPIAAVTDTGRLDLRGAQPPSCRRQQQHAAAALSPHEGDAARLAGATTGRMASLVAHGPSRHLR